MIQRGAEVLGALCRGARPKLKRDVFELFIPFLFDYLEKKRIFSISFEEEYSLVEASLTATSSVLSSLSNQEKSDMTFSRRLCCAEAHEENLLSRLIRYPLDKYEQDGSRLHAMTSKIASFIRVVVESVETCHQEAVVSDLLAQLSNYRPHMKESGFFLLCCPLYAAIYGGIHVDSMLMRSEFPLLLLDELIELCAEKVTAEFSLQNLSHIIAVLINKVHDITSSCFTSCV